MLDPKDFIFQYWGKAQPAKATTRQWHPLAFHSLDVAAAGEAILEVKARLLKEIAHAAGIPETTCKDWLLFLLALHDLGKFADCFQCLVPEHWVIANREAWQTKGYAPLPVPHGIAGAILWTDHVGKAVLGTLNWNAETLMAFEEWLRPVFGHHGKPISDSGVTKARDIATGKAISDAIAYAITVPALLLTDGKPIDSDLIHESGIRTASWLIAGFSVMADWIGSNQEWFPYTDPNLNLPDYWQIARGKAEAAVAKAGLVKLMPARSYRLKDALNVEKADATPLQAWAASVELPSGGPCLAFLEDLTGSGKTEAALILAQRLISSGKASGIYWALPTQATANALYRRLRGSYKKLFIEGDAIPSLALAHASTDLQKDYQASIFKEGLMEAAGRAERDYGSDDEDTASAQCAGWLASDRRRSLLADIGVGTVDQALLAALPVKFQSLRLTALSDRILVVDEAHSYDAYTTRLLKQLLAFHAALGGSAIILSATLTSKTKNELLTAFAAGAGWVNPHWCEKAESRTDAFPLASLLGAPVSRGSYSPRESPLTPMRGTRRDLKVKRLDDGQAAVSSLIEHARAGRCAVWIRNTVQDAIDGAEALSKAAPELDGRLFHARFTLADRAVIEKEVVDGFGKASTPEQRAPKGLGRIVVTTQVVEQSLDLDFDAMVSDLAPIDLIIQRAGRLHRHDRGLRPDPVLEIVSPAPVDDAPVNWYSALFPRASFVYPHPGHLWRTITLLEEACELRLANENPRELLHAVFNDADYPAAFDKAVCEWEGKCSAEQAVAAGRVLDPAKGYSEQQRGFYDEARSPTRLGEDSRVVKLAKWQDGKLTPWADSDGDETRAWRMSEIQLRAYKAHARGIYAPEIEKASETIEGAWLGRAQTALLLPLISQGEYWSGSFINKDGKPIAIRYDALHGLQFLSWLPTARTRGDEPVASGG